MRKSFSLLSALISAFVSASTVYPVIRPLNFSTFVKDAQHANIIIPIKSKNGHVLYKIECHSLGYGYDNAFDYSGEFECKLISLREKNEYSTLFTENERQSRDWESRARFFSLHLQGKCAKVTNFGAHRVFQLRGMRVSLEIVSPKIIDGRLKSFRFNVTARKDALANRSIAAKVPLPASAPKECALEVYFPN